MGNPDSLGCLFVLGGIVFIVSVTILRIIQIIPKQDVLWVSFIIALIPIALAGISNRH